MQKVFGVVVLQACTQNASPSSFWLEKYRFLLLFLIWIRLSLKQKMLASECWSTLTGYKTTIARKLFCIHQKCRLQLKRGLFWYDIIQKCTKWCQIGVHGLKIGQIFAKFQCAFFWSETMSFFVKTNLWEATRAIPKLEKTIKIYNLIKFN